VLTPSAAAFIVDKVIPSIRPSSRPRGTRPSNGRRAGFQIGECVAARLPQQPEGIAGSGCKGRRETQEPDTRTKLTRDDGRRQGPALHLRRGPELLRQYIDRSIMPRSAARNDVASIARSAMRKEKYRDCAERSARRDAENVGRNQWVADQRLIG